MKRDRLEKELLELEDIHADLVTEFGLYEGFGNALLEAYYFKKPVVLNRYSNFVKDIEPKGFDVITADGILTGKVVDEVKAVMENSEHRRKMVEHNFDLARSFYSYSVLRRKLRALVCNVTGADDL